LLLYLHLSAIRLPADGMRRRPATCGKAAFGPEYRADLRNLLGLAAAGFPASPPGSPQSADVPGMTLLNRVARSRSSALGRGPWHPHG
jgi:hypothetical protein